MFCMKCGTENPPNVNFCMRCGASLENSKQVHAGNTPAPSLQTPQAAPASQSMPFSQPVQTYTQAPVTAMNPVDPMAGQSRQDGPGNKNIAIIIAVAAVALVAILGVIFFVMGSGSSSSSPNSSQSSTAQSSESSSGSNVSSATKQEVTESAASTGSSTAAASSAPPSFGTPGASSTLSGDIDSHAVTTVIDGDTTTAWSEGESGNGEGSWIEFTAPSEQTVSSIAIMGGFCKSETLYYGNSRPKDITISFDHGNSTKATLNDSPFAWQTITLEQPVQTSTVRITIDSVYPGSTYQDTSISEIKIS